MAQISTYNILNVRTTTKSKQIINNDCSTWIECIEGQQQESRKLCCTTEPKFKVPEECKIQGKGEKESDRDKETEPEERENHAI